MQRLATIGEGSLAITTAAGDDPAQGKPLGEHRFLRRGRRRGQETAQVGRQFLGGVQLAGKPQGPAVQDNQPGRADQQAVGQIHFPTQQHADILLGEQLLLRQALYQVRRHIEMAGPQGLLHRFVQQALPFEPAAGTQVQSRLGATGLPAAQQVGKQMVIAEPQPMLIQRHQEHLVGLQVAQDLGTVVPLAQGIAQFGAETLLAGGVVEKRLHRRRQDLDHLFEQIIANQSLAAMQCLGQGVVIAGFAGRQLPEAQPSHPAVAALDQVVRAWPRRPVG